MDSNKKYILLYVSVITGIVSLVAWIILSSTSPILVGTTLNEQFLSTLRTHFILSRLGSGFLYLFIFSAGAAFAFFLRIAIDRPQLVIAGIAIFVIGIAVSCVLSSHVVAPMFNDPEVATVTVVKKDLDYRGSKVKRWHYFLYFSNGSELAVAEDKYKRTNVGDVHYVVMCGSDPIASYSASEYKLP